MHMTLGKHSHVMEDMRRFCDMGELTEDFVERDH